MISGVLDAYMEIFGSLLYVIIPKSYLGTGNARARAVSDSLVELVVLAVRHIVEAQVLMMIR